MRKLYFYCLCIFGFSLIMYGQKGDLDDFDGDSIINSVDLDDDNDGILDIIESPECYYASNEQPLIGDRTSYEGFNVSSELNIYSAYSIGESIDGSDTASSNLRYYNSQLVAGKIIYKVELPEALTLDGLKFNYSTTYGSFNNAVVMLQGSNDGVIWTDLNVGNTYVVNPSPDEDEFLVTQNSANYKYYHWND